MNNDLRRLPFLVKLSRSTRASSTRISVRRLFIIIGLRWPRFDYIGPIAPRSAQRGSLIVIFNSARLVRKGEELEHYHPEPVTSKNDTARNRSTRAEASIAGGRIMPNGHEKLSACSSAWAYDSVSNRTK
jgi:hypothetical protein